MEHIIEMPSSRPTQRGRKKAAARGLPAIEELCVVAVLIHFGRECPVHGVIDTGVSPAEFVRNPMAAER